MHRDDLLALLERAPTLSEVMAFFKEKYGYGPAAIYAILEENGISFPPSRIQWSKDDRKRHLQDLSTAELAGYGVNNDKAMGWGV